jgi:hypothetical protein
MQTTIKEEPMDEMKIKEEMPVAVGEASDDVIDDVEKEVMKREGRCLLAVVSGHSLIARVKAQHVREACAPVQVKSVLIISWVNTEKRCMWSCYIEVGDEASLPSLRRRLTATGIVGWETHVYNIDPHNQYPRARRIPSARHQVLPDDCEIEKYRFIMVRCIPIDKACYQEARAVLGYRATIPTRDGIPMGNAILKCDSHVHALQTLSRLDGTEVDGQRLLFYLFDQRRIHRNVRRRFAEIRSALNSAEVEVGSANVGH